MKNQDQKLQDLLLHEKPIRIILHLKDSRGKYASILSKESDCTYTHTLKILTKLEDLGMVAFNKEGRIKEVCLTEEGADIAHELEGLIRRLERIKTGDKKDTEKSEGDPNILSQ